MKKTSISGFGVCVLGLLLVAFMGRLTLAQTGRTERQKSENPPLSTASNSLSNFFGQKQPVLQKNYKNPEDLWLLYSPDFDRLSGNAQSYLLRKYGIQEFTLPQRDGKVNDEGLDLLNRTQSETSSATAGSNIVVVYNDAGLPFYGSAISFSKDGGRTWKQTFPPVFAFGEGLGDPVVAAGPDDIFYFSFLAFNGSGFSTIGLTRSIDGGATWSKLVNATAGVTGGTNFH